MGVSAEHTSAERGILFSRAMVEALLAGRKTQTRRAIRPQPSGATAAPRNPFGQPGDRLWVRERFAAFGHWRQRHNARKGREEWFFTDLTRERGLAWRYEDGPAFADAHASRDADAAPAWHARPALFMPRAASRILLEIVAVRAERLQAIGVDDAVAEGVVAEGVAAGDDPVAERVAAGEDPVAAYRGVWEGINGAGSWAADPMVWVVVFRRLVPE